MPSSNRTFWKKKIQGNRRNDERHLVELKESGWRVLVVWECSIRGAGPDALGQVARKTVKWLRSKSIFRQIRGKAKGRTGGKYR